MAMKLRYMLNSLGLKCLANIGTLIAWIYYNITKHISRRDRNVNPSAANLGWDQTSNIRLYALYLLAYTQTLASDQPDTTSQIKALLACRVNNTFYEMTIFYLSTV